MTTPWAVPLTAPDDGWTSDDLDAMPCDGVRRELVDGVLVVSGRTWTAAEFAGIPRDGARRDLIDGVLWVFPRASAAHGEAVERVAAVLSGECPTGVTVRRAVEVRVGAATVLRPDLHVTSGAGESSVPLVAVEFATRFNRAACAELYPALYAAAGIPHYWKIDLTPELRVSTFDRNPASGVYRPTGEFTDIIKVDAPWPITLPFDQFRPRDMS